MIAKIKTDEGPNGRSAENSHFEGKAFHKSKNNFLDKNVMK